MPQPLDQHVMVDALGRPITEYNEADRRVDLSVLGPQTIERFSVVRHDTETQRFYIEFRETAPRVLIGRLATGMLIRAYLGLDAADLNFDVNRVQGTHNVATFDSYGGAVQAERRVLAAMMRASDMRVPG